MIPYWDGTFAYCGKDSDHKSKNKQLSTIAKNREGDQMLKQIRCAEIRSRRRRNAENKSSNNQYNWQQILLRNRQDLKEEKQHHWKKETWKECFYFMTLIYSNPLPHPSSEPIER